MVYMTDKEIAQLKELAKEGNVYWINADGVAIQVLGVKLDWVEFKDQPELTEPAAILKGTVPVALYETSSECFVAMAPLFEPAAVAA